MFKGILLYVCMYSLIYFFTKPDFNTYGLKKFHSGSSQRNQEFRMKNLQYRMNKLKLLLNNPKLKEGRRKKLSNKLKRMQRMENSLNDSIQSNFLENVQWNNSSKLPKWIIIGARKAGTAAVASMLNLHPQIRRVPGETHFFNKYYERGLDWYRSQMPIATGSINVIEKTPNYFTDPKARYRIRDSLPDVHLILVIRNPVQRAVSDWLHSRDMGDIPKNSTFESTILLKNGEINENSEVLQNSLYSKYLVKWLEVFAYADITIVDGDKLKKTPLPEIKSLFTQMKVSQKLTNRNFYFNETKGFYCFKKKQKSFCLGSNKGRKHPKIKQTTLKKLKKFFQKEKQKINNLTGKRFNWS